MTHLLAFLAGAAAMFVVMVIDAVMPIRLRRKPKDDEPGGGW